jgi:hypothetical protein
MKTQREKMPEKDSSPSIANLEHEQLSLERSFRVDYGRWQQPRSRKHKISTCSTSESGVAIIASIDEDEI